MSLISILILLMVVIVIYLAIGGYIAYISTLPGDHPQFQATPGTYQLDYIEETIIARDDQLKIAAWFIPNQNASKAIILVHGRDASKQNAISGKFPQLAAELHKAGFTVLMIDTRGHGDSAGRRYSFGVYEQRDVLGAVDYLVGKGYFPGEIVALGISNGGAAVINAAVKESSIGAVILDSTLADLNLLMEIEFKKRNVPKIFIYSADVMNQLFFGYSLRAVKPVDTINSIEPRPILLLHSVDDEMVDFVHAKKLQAAAPSAELISFSGCDHAELYRDDPAKYFEAINSFLSKMS